MQKLPRGTPFGVVAAFFSRPYLKFSLPWPCLLEVSMKTFACCLPLLFCLAAVSLAGEVAKGKEFTNSLGMKFVRVEPGTFTQGMGTDVPLSKKILSATEHGGRDIKLAEHGEFGDFDERPTMESTISSPYYLGVHEVTNQQYEQFDALHIHLRGKQGFSIDRDEAVVFVSWHEAQAFCDWLSEKEGLPYRLPTEAEWEYACRSGTDTPYSTGADLPEEFIKNPDNSWYPCPARGRGREEVVPLHVGKTTPNAWGLFDMHGNVEEWCHDWYGSYPGGKQTDPVGRADGEFKVARGGSHGTVAYYLRSANRMGTLPQDKSFMIGFRVVLGELPATLPEPVPERSAYQQDVRQDVPPDAHTSFQPDEPYFRGPRVFVRIPEGSNGPLFSRHNHDPALTECPNGDLLAIWYSTVTERGRLLGLAASRLRYGAEEWDIASPFWDVPDRNDHAPALFYDGDRTIFHFVGLSTAATWGPLAVVLRKSVDNGATWGRAKLPLPEHQRRNQVIDSVFRTHDGALVLPCDASPSSGGGSALHLSWDEGLTWTDPGGTIRGIHAGVAELSDGRFLALGRGDTLPEAPDRVCKNISRDQGKTWEYSPTEFPKVSGGQRPVLLRLREGPLFYVGFARESKDRPFLITDASGTKRPVTGIYAAVSYDDGETWPHIRPITDDGPPREIGTTNGNRSKFTMSRSSAEPKGYLAGEQARNGVIHLISSWNHYAFNLKWIETPAPALE